MFGLPAKLNSTLYWMTQRLRLPVSKYIFLSERCFLFFYSSSLNNANTNGNTTTIVVIMTIIADYVRQSFYRSSVIHIK